MNIKALLNVLMIAALPIFSLQAVLENPNHLLAQNIKPKAPEIIPSAPQLGAPSYILIDFDSGHVLLEKDADVKREPASLTKMMTTFVVDQEIKRGKIKLNDMVLISEKAWRTGGSRTFLEVGKQFPLEELLRGAIIQSGNDASVAMAEHVAGTEEGFADLMNQYAKSIGMENSHFENATGLSSSNHYSTARDLAILGRAMINDFPEQYKIHSEKWHTVNGIRQPNRNLLLWRDPTVDGIKTGFTEPAGYCLAASAKRNNMRLVSIILGSKDPETRAKETQQLLSYGFRFFQTEKLYAKNQPLLQPRVWMGEQKFASLGLNQDLFVTIPQGQRPQIEAQLELNKDLEAPVKAGDSYGTVIVSLKGNKLAEIPLVALNDVPQGGFWRKFSDAVSRSWEHLAGKDDTKKAAS